MCRARFLEDLLKDGSDWIRPAPAGVWVHGTESLGYINVGRMILYRYWNCVPVLTNATIGRADKGNLACNTCFRLVSQMCWLLFKCSMQNLLFVWFWTRKEDETFLFKRRRAYELLLHNVFSGRSAPTPQCSARRIWWELLQLIVVCIVDAVCH